MPEPRLARLKSPAQNPPRRRISGRPDSNRGPRPPKGRALPGCATPRGAESSPRFGPHGRGTTFLEARRRRTKVDLKNLTDKAKELIDKRGGTDSLKEDAGELKDIASKDE